MEALISIFYLWRWHTARSMKQCLYVACALAWRKHTPAALVETLKDFVILYVDKDTMTPLIQELALLPPSVDHMPVRMYRLHLHVHARRSVLHGAVKRAMFRIWVNTMPDESRRTVRRLRALALAMVSSNNELPAITRVLVASLASNLSKRDWESRLMRLRQFLALSED